MWTPKSAEREHGAEHGTGIGHDVLAGSQKLWLTTEQRQYLEKKSPFAPQSTSFFNAGQCKTMSL